MPDTVLASMNANTPKVMALDPRGLTVRTVDYHRARTDLPAQARITRQKYDAQGRLGASIDPRLGRLAEKISTVKDNLRCHFSLSAATIFSDSVDAGWRLTLFNETGESSCSWDRRGLFRQRTFDELNRLVAVSESIADQPVVVERMGYGRSDAETATRNQCGRRVRHDDTVGSETTSDFGLLGAAIVQTRRFARSLLSTDWPLDEEARDLLLEEQPYTTRWEMSALGETLRLIDARQNIQRNAYDLTGNLKQVYLRVTGSAEVPVIRAISYNEDNKTEREIAGNGVITLAGYDRSDGRLIHLHSALNSQPPLHGLRYTYDAVGNVTEVHDEVAAPVYFRNQRIEHRCNYGYDSLYQLIWSTGFEALDARNPAQVANFRETYEYDDAGNMHTLVHTGNRQYTRRMVTAIYSNRSLPVYEDEVPGEPEITAGFDTNGNSRMLLRGQVLAWDGRNQLQRVTPVFRPGGEDDSEVYGYDSQGQRLRKSSTRLNKFGSVIREVRYLPGVELNTDSNTGRVYQVVRLAAGLARVCVMHWESEPPSGMQPEHWWYSLSDHLGSSGVELSQEADVLSREWYLPYGGTAWWVDNGSPEASYKTIRYSGKERDATGLYYYGLRYYAPWLQRWINPDPAGNIDGLNLYRFVRSNPVTLSDSDGLSPPNNLLYGFDDARRQFYSRYGRANPDQSLIFINFLNTTLGVTHEKVNEDYLGLLKDIGDGIDIGDSDAQYFKKISRLYQGTVGEAKSLLQSWSDYLKLHVDSLSVTRKLERLEQRGKSLDEFWKKNTSNPMSSTYFGVMSGVLKNNPRQFFSPGSSAMSEAKHTSTTWFFRQTSKLALEWFTQLTGEGNIIFLDVEPKDPSRDNSGWKPLAPTNFSAKPYKSTVQIGTTYNPITFSERRFIQKKIADPNSAQAKRINILSYTQVSPYLR